MAKNDNLKKKFGNNFQKNKNSARKHIFDIFFTLDALKVL